MSDWRTQTTTLHPEHPNYDEFHAYFNRRRVLTNEEPLPYGAPVEVPVRFLYTPKVPPIGVGYCQRCGEVMLIRDEKQKWCSSCRLLIDLERMAGLRGRRSRRKPDRVSGESSVRGDCDADDCSEDAR